MAVSVDAVFKLLDEASGPLRTIRREARETDKALRGMGGGTSSGGFSGGMTRQFSVTRDGIKSIGTATKDLKTGAEKATNEVRKLGREGEKVAGVFRRRVLPVFKTLGKTLGMGVGGVLGGLKGLVTAFPPLVTAIAVAAPAIVALAGAVGALGTSLAAAAGGGAILGGGLLGAFAVGLGSLAVVAKPAMTQLKQYTALQKQLNAAIASGSTSAIKAKQKQLDQFGKQHPGVAKLSDSLKGVKKQWDRLSAPARNSFFKLAADGISTLKADMPALAGVVNKNMAAIQTNFKRHLEPFLKSKAFTGFVGQLGSVFRKNLPGIMKGLASGIQGLSNILKVVAPTLDKFGGSFAKSMKHFADFTASARGKGAIADMVEAFKKWAHFLHEAARVIGSIIGTTSKPGSDVIGKWAAKLKEVADSFSKPGGTKGISGFWKRSLDQTQQLFTLAKPLLGDIRAIYKIIKPMGAAAQFILKTIPPAAVAAMLAAFVGFKIATGVKSGISTARSLFGGKHDGSEAHPLWVRLKGGLGGGRNSKGDKGGSGKSGALAAGEGTAAAEAAKKESVLRRAGITSPEAGPTERFLAKHAPFGARTFSFASRAGSIVDAGGRLFSKLALPLTAVFSLIAGIKTPGNLVQKGIGAAKFADPVNAFAGLLSAAGLTKAGSFVSHFAPTNVLNRFTKPDKFYAQNPEMGLQATQQLGIPDGYAWPRLQAGVSIRDVQAGWLGRSTSLQSLKHRALGQMRKWGVGGAGGTQTASALRHAIAQEPAHPRTVAGMFGPQIDAPGGGTTALKPILPGGVWFQAFDKLHDHSIDQAKDMGNKVGTALTNLVTDAVGTNSTGGFKGLNAKGSTAVQTLHDTVNTLFQDMTKNMTTETGKQAATVTSLTGAVSVGLNDMIKQVNAALKGFGVGKMVAAVSKAGSGAASGIASVAGHARGGRIPGQPAGDHVPLVGRGGSLLGMADGGELVVNRHTEGRVNAKLARFGTTLGREVAGETRPHFAQGGRVTVGSLNHPYGPSTVLPVNIIAALAEWAGMPGVTFAQIARGESGYRPGAIEPREASGAQGFGLWQMTTGVGNDALIARFGGARGMLNPVSNARAADVLYRAGGVSPWHGTQFMTSPNAHYTGPPLVGGISGGGTGLNIPTLHGPAGGLLNLGNAALRRAGRAGQSYLQRQMPTATMGAAGGAPGARGPGGFGTFDGIQTANWIIPILNWARGHGWSGHITSGYRPEAGSEHATSRWPGGAVDVGYNTDIADGTALYNVLKRYPGRPNLLWGGQYISGYTDPRGVTAPGGHDFGHFSGTGHALGGRIPWYGRGTDFIARRPQLIGVGDGPGPERVTVTPAGSGGHHSVQIGKLVIQNHRAGDVREQIKREVAQAFDDLGRHLDNQMMEDSETVMTGG